MNKNNILLSSILNKAIYSIDHAKRHEILMKWSKIDNLKSYNYKILFFFMFVSVMIILAILYRKKLLEKEYLKLAEAYEENQALKTQIELAILGNHDGIWDWNILSNEVYFSPAWKKILGYEDHELENIFSTWEHRIHPIDKKTL